MLVHDVERRVADKTGMCAKTVFNVMKEYRQIQKESYVINKLVALWMILIKMQ